MYPNPSWASQITVPTGYLTPWNLYEYYGFNLLPDTPANNGYGQKIAIIGVYGAPNLQSDLDTFCANMKIPSTTVSIYYPFGTVNFNSYNTYTTPSSASVNQWAYEASVDVQYAHAMALSATIVYVVSPDLSDNNVYGCVQYAVNTLSANIVAMSVSIGEAGRYYLPSNSYSDANVFNNKAAQYISASGDYGSLLSYPGISPNVLSVGGTTLSGGNSSYYGGAPGPYEEVAWGTVAGASGGGGGQSNVNPKPSYQVGISPFPNRATPDVAYNAGGYVQVYFTSYYTGISNWVPANGTSCGVPQWAAIAAIRNANGKGSLGRKSINEDIYALASQNYSIMFNNITRGSNGYAAGPGYDLATGLGSPKVNGLVLSGTN